MLRVGRWAIGVLDTTVIGEKATSGCTLEYSLRACFFSYQTRLQQIPLSPLHSQAECQL